jgi:large subunit ribosomal protein L21
MYAIVSVGGKQYRVEEGTEFKVERLDLKGKKATLKEVLLISDNGKVEVGRPFLEKARVICEVVKEEKAKKVVIFKYRRRKNYRRKTGHRQILSLLKVKEIKLNEATT